MLSGYRAQNSQLACLVSTCVVVSTVVNGFGYKPLPFRERFLTCYGLRGRLPALLTTGTKNMELPPLTISHFDAVVRRNLKASGALSVCFRATAPRTLSLHV